ncbi:hypothetical protein TWF281_010712 [Arthrobotrys megalospora]
MFKGRPSTGSGGDPDAITPVITPGSRGAVVPPSERSIGQRAIKHSVESEENYARNVQERRNVIKNTKKRLFVCCDGTWKNAPNNASRLTNVARFARAVDRYSAEDDKTVPQLTYYCGGVGSHSALGGVTKKYFGATGAGLEEIILSSYNFLSNNYNFEEDREDDDDIILIGYSRGAFAVRCLADLISQIGLLRRKNLIFLSDLFKKWMETKDIDGRAAMKQNVLSCPLLSIPVKIAFLGEWDPVSAVGHTRWSKRFSFVKHMVPAEVEYVYTAIAIHERRASFEPMIFRKTAPESKTEITQCAFIGCHGDVGGGSRDAALSTVSLLWMVSKVRRVCGAEFDSGALFQMIQPLRPKEQRSSPQVKGINLIYSEGAINESLKKIWVPLEILNRGIFYGWTRKILEQVPSEEEPSAQASPQSQPRDDNPSATFKIHNTVKELYLTHYELKPGWLERVSSRGPTPKVATMATDDMNPYECDLWEEWSKQQSNWNPDGKTEGEILNSWLTQIGEWSEALITSWTKKISKGNPSELQDTQNKAQKIQVCQILEMCFLVSALEGADDGDAREGAGGPQNPLDREHKVEVTHTETHTRAPYLFSILCVFFRWACNRPRVQQEQVELVLANESSSSEAEDPAASIKRRLRGVVSAAVESLDSLAQRHFKSKSVDDYLDDYWDGIRRLEGDVERFKEAGDGIQLQSSASDLRDGVLERISQIPLVVTNGTEKSELTKKQGQREILGFLVDYITNGDVGISGVYQNLQGHFSIAEVEIKKYAAPRRYKREEALRAASAVRRIAAVIALITMAPETSQNDITRALLPKGFELPQKESVR